MKFKKWLVRILVICMLATSMPFPSFAKSEAERTESLKKSTVSIDEQWVNAKIDEIAKIYQDQQKKEGKLTDWWAIIELAKYEQIQGTFGPETFTEGTKQWVKRKTIDEDTQKPNSDVNSLTKNILAIRSMGYDPENYYGVNLVELLANRADFGKEVNAWGPALNALTSDDYKKSPSLKKATDQLKSQILQAQGNDGLWQGYSLPWDITGFALYALAPYYGEADVKQKLDGTFQAIGNEMLSNGDLTQSPGNANSLEMVLGGVAACDPGLLTKDYMVRNNKTLVDGLKAYAIKDGFAWIIGQDGGKEMATEQGFRALLSYIGMVKGKGGVFDFRGVDKQEAKDKDNRVEAYKDWLARKYKECSDKTKKRPDDQSPMLYPGMVRNKIQVPEQKILQLADQQKGKDENRRDAKDLAQVILNLRVLGKDPENYKETNFVAQLVGLRMDKFRRVDEIEAAIYALTSDDYKTPKKDERLKELIEALLNKRNGSSKLWESYGDWQEDTGNALGALAAIVRTNPNGELAENAKKALEETIKLVAGKQLANGDFTKNDWADGSIGNLGAILKGLAQKDPKLLMDEQFQKSGDNLLDVLKAYDLPGGLFSDTRNDKDTGLDLKGVEQALSIILWSMDHKGFIYDFRSIPKEGGESVDKTPLIEKIKEGLKEEVRLSISKDGKDVLTKDFYITPEESKAFKGAIKEAEALVENNQATKEDVQKQVKKLDQAIQTLKGQKKPGLKVPVNKAKLQEAIQEAKEAKKNIPVGEDPAKFLKGVKFVSQTTLDALNQALGQGEALEKREDAKQEEVNQMVDALKKAIETFKAGIQTGTKDAVDQAKLKAILEKGKRESQAYPVTEDPQEVPVNQLFTTAANKEALDKLLTKAQKLLENPDASKADGDAMIQELETGIKKFTDGLKEGKQLKDGVYFQKDSGEIILMDEDKTFQLSALDQGRFILKAKNSNPDWQADEQMKLDEYARKTHYWISTDGRFNPRVAKTMDAKVVNMADGKAYTFKIQQVPSNIEELKILVDGREVSTTNPIQMQGSAPKHIVVQGRRKGSQNFQSIPYQALSHDATGQGGNTGGQFGKRITPNWDFQISSEPITYEIYLKEDEKVKASFTAVPSHVAVQDFNIRVPKKAYIHAWNGIFGDYFVGIQRGPAANEYMETFTPSNATNRGLTWEALTPDIAEFMEVHKNGIVPKKAGLAKFKVTSEDNPQISKIVEIEFAYKEPLKKASIKEDVIRMKKGDNLSLEIETLPQEASEKRFYWSFDQDGIVKIKDSVTNDPTNINIPKKTSHGVTAYKDGIVKVKGIPYDQTGGAQALEFTIIVGDAKLPEDKSPLKEALSQAEAMKKADTTSPDGKDVDKNKTWVTAEVKAALDQALEKAKIVDAKTDASQEEVKQAIQDLKEAMANYTPKNGTKEASQPAEPGKPVEPGRPNPPHEEKEKPSPSPSPRLSFPGFFAWTSQPEKTLEKTPEKIQVKEENKEPQVQAQPQNHFLDIQGHWAEKVIQEVAKKGYFKGTSATNFSPNKTTTRAEFVTVLGRLAKINPSQYPKAQQVDIQEGSYYQAYVNWAIAEGIVKGTDANHFSPDQKITREEVATILARYLEKQGKLKSKQVGQSYKDQEQISPWAKEAVRKMTEAGIFKGQGKGNFAPNKTFTRAEFAQVITKIEAF